MRLWETISILLVVLCLSPLSVSGKYPLSLLEECSCRSNATHVAWNSAVNMVLEQPLAQLHTSAIQRKMSAAQACHKCYYQPISLAVHESLQYLRANLMPFEEPFLETLGFSTSNDDDVDGLSNGLVGPTVSLALIAKQNYSWTDALPRHIFYEYVVNYANVNEARTNWRPLLLHAVTPMLQQQQQQQEAPTTIPEVVRIINTHLWKALARHDNETIVFRGGQTPLIFDPMSVIAFGYGSCTGLAILFVNALRAAGVPARIVGTPAWMGRREEGNHNWVEVYHDGQWSFMEPSPAQSTVDTLDRDPCQRWFCHPDRFPGTKVYAARLDRNRSDTYYPMAWEWNSTDVPGVDRTEYYTSVCSQC